MRELLRQKDYPWFAECCSPLSAGMGQRRGRAVGLPEGDNLFPDGWRLEHQRIVRGLRKFPEVFRPRIVVVELEAKSLRDDAVLAADQHSERAAIVTQIIFGGKAVPQEQSDRQNADVCLGDIRQAAIRREQGDPGDLLGVEASQISGDT